MSGLAAAALCCAAAVVALRPRSAPPALRHRVPLPRPTWAPERLARPAALALGLGLGAVVHPIAGAMAGAALVWLLPPLVERLEGAADARRSDDLAEQLPVVAGLLSACLSAGASLPDSLRTVAEAVSEPAASVLSAAHRTVSLGGGPDDVAAVLADPGVPAWQRLAADLARSTRTGAPLAEVLHDRAEDSLREWSAAATARARSVAVRAVLPLALCFLPAFLLLGIVPVVAGLLEGLDLP